MFVYVLMACQRRIDRPVQCPFEGALDTDWASVGLSPLFRGVEKAMGCLEVVLQGFDWGPNVRLLSFLVWAP